MKKEPPADYVLILPPATIHEPAPQAEVSKVVKPKRARLSRPKLASSSSVFKCDECSYQTNDKSNLMRHKGVHNKSIQCENCRKKYSTNQSLKLHQMQHKHGAYATALAETFDCDICDKSFSTQKLMKQHQRKVHAEDGYNRCGFKSKQKNRLTYHIKSKHRSGASKTKTRSSRSEK